MKKYDSYKDSGIEWIGEIPSHWEEYRLGVIGGFTSSGIDKKIVEDEPTVKIINYTDVYGNKEKVLNTEKDYMEVTSPQSKINQHTVKKGDLIFTPSSETKEDIGLSAVVVDDLYNTAFSYHVLRFQFNKEVNLLFKKYLCNNYPVLNYFSKNSKGTTRQILGREDFKNAKVVFPPISEQISIAYFLDSKTYEIDEIIADKKRLLELYEEEKTAIINKAVTKGINPDASMKDSGIEWLGEIPKHWEVKKLKYVVKINSGEGIKSENIKTEGNYPVYGGNGIIGYTDSFNSAETQIIIGRVGAKCGNIRLVSGRKWVSDNALIANITTKVDNKFLSIQMHNMDLNQMSNQNAQPLITGSMVKERGALFPPIQEQQSIVQHIESECSRIDFKKARTEELIELLTEYRTALISEAVTGKIKVTED